MTFECDPIDMVGFSPSWNKQSSKSYNDAEIEFEISQFPKTRYYGSKRRLLNWIYHAVKNLPFTTVLDGFGGTASVSLLFKAMGKQVSYHDALISNTISAHALLADQFPFSDVKQAFQFIAEIEPKHDFISETFSGMYYTDAENQWLDGAVEAIDELADPLLRSAYFYCLFQACLKKRPFNIFHRANLNLRLNKNIKRSFGNLTTWEKSFVPSMQEGISDLEKLKRHAVPSIILPCGDISTIKSEYDLVYFDPPYISTTQNSDNYLQRYHFLEGLSEYHGWREKINFSSKNNAINNSGFLRSWSNKSDFKQLLFDLILKNRKSIVVLSYVAGAYPSEQEIKDLFDKTFRISYVLRKEMPHALAKKPKTELLFIGL